MEDKLNELLNDGDYYSAHQLILSLTKRKVKTGKINEAVSFVKNGVARLCAANQFASAADAGISIFEYANMSNFEDIKEIFAQLLNSEDSQFWRKFLNEMGKNNFLNDDSETKEEILDLILESKASGNAEKLSAAATIILQLSGEKRILSLSKFSNCLSSDRQISNVVSLHVYFLADLSLNLIKAGQFYDNEYFLKTFSSTINGEDVDNNEIIAPIETEDLRLFNLCVLLNYLCQRKSPTKALFLEILNQYLPESICNNNSELNRLRYFAENSLGQVFWPAPKIRSGAGSGGPPPDLMNMLQGLLGPQMRH